MKLRVHTQCRPVKTVMAFSAAFLCLAFVSHAATTPTNSSSKASKALPPVSAPTLVEPEIPQSVFVVPTSPRAGRDPFFPRTTRLFASTGTTTSVKTNPPTFALDLILKGISGTQERPLAIINNQTFAAGEENDIVSGTRRVRIRCLEINMAAETVTVQMGSERRELRLKPSK